MEYRERREDEVRELRRPRAVTREELDELLRRVGDHRSAEQKRIDHLSLAAGERELREDASAAAQEYLVRGFIETWEATGQAIPWHAEPQVFRSKSKLCLIDLYRKQLRQEKSVTTTEDLDDYFATHSTHTQPIHGDTGDSALETLSLPLLIAVAARTLKAAARREQKPHLGLPQQQVARIFLELEFNVRAMTDTDMELLKGFEHHHQRWKSELAKHLGRNPSFVSTALTAIAGLIRSGIYLFVVLAPRGRAVIETAEISRLLDIVYSPNDDLEAGEQNLLQIAGQYLYYEEGTYPIDVAPMCDAVAGKAPHAEPVEALHRAETRYAVHVPGQAPHVPKFLCVVRCARHLP